MASHHQQPLRSLDELQARIANDIGDYAELLLRKANTREPGAAKNRPGRNSNGK